MKIRNGFVSNSSTSSFLLYGIQLDENEIQSFIKKYANVNFEKDKAKYLKDDFQEGCFSYEKYNKKIKETGLQIINHIGYEEPENIEIYGIYLGIDLGEIENIKNIPLDNLIAVREELKHFDKEIKFHGGIIQEC